MVSVKRHGVWLLGAVTLGCVEVPGLAECSAGSPCEPGAVCESGTCVPSGDASTSGPDASRPPAPDAAAPPQADASPRPDAARPPMPDARPPQPDGAGLDAGPPPTPDMALPPPTPDLAIPDAAIPDLALPPPTPDLALPAPTPDMAPPPAPDMAFVDAAIPDMAPPPAPDMALVDAAIPDMAPPPVPDMAVLDSGIPDAALPPPDPACPHPLPWSREYTLWALTDAAFEAYDPTAVFADDAPPLVRSAPLPDAGVYRPGDLTLLPDGERALVFGAGGDVTWRGAVQTVDLTDGEVLTRSPVAVPAPAAGVRAAALAPGGRTAFALFGIATRTVTSVDLESGAITPLGTVEDGAVLAVTWSGTPVVAGGERLSVPDPAGAVEIGTVPGAGALSGLLADPDAERVFAWGGRVLARAALDGPAPADVVSVEPFGGEGATVLAATVRGDIVLALGRTPTPAAEVTLARLDATTLAVLDTVVVSADAPVGDDAWRLAATYDAELVAVGAVGGISLQVFTVADLDPAGPPAALGAPLRDLALWAPVAEICDGLDEDCDGETDEDWDMGGVCQAPGVCGAGAWACAGPRDRRCDAYDRAAEADACNGLDDDCDGATDEDVPYLGAAVAVMPGTPGFTPELVPLPDGPAAGEVGVLHSGSGRLHLARYDRDLVETLAPVEVPGVDPAGEVVAAWNGRVIGVAYNSSSDRTAVRFVALSVDGEVLADPATIDDVALNENGLIGLSIATGDDGRFGVLTSIRETPNSTFVVVDAADLAATPPPTTVCAGGAWTLPLWFTGGAFATVGVGHGCQPWSEALLIGRRWDADGARLADPARELVNQSPNIPYTTYGRGFALDPASGTVGIVWAPVAWSRTGDPVGTLRYQRFGPTLAAVTQPVTLRILHPIAAYDGNQGALQIRPFRLVHNATRGRLGLWHQQDPLRVGAGMDEFFAEILPDGTMAAGPVMIDPRANRLRWWETVWFEDRYVFGGYRANLDGSTSAYLRAGPVFCDAVAPPGP